MAVFLQVLGAINYSCVCGLCDMLNGRVRPVSLKWTKQVKRVKRIMRSMSAHDAKAKFGQLLDAVREGPVAISKHGREVAVVISKEEFDAVESLKLDRLRAEVQKGFESIERGDFMEVSPADLAELGETIKAEGRKRKPRK